MDGRMGDDDDDEEEDAMGWGREGEEEKQAGKIGSPHFRFGTTLDRDARWAACPKGERPDCWCAHSAEEADSSMARLLLDARRVLAADAVTASDESWHFERRGGKGHAGPDGLACWPVCVPAAGPAWPWLVCKGGRWRGREQERRRRTSEMKRRTDSDRRQSRRDGLRDSQPGGGGGRKRQVHRRDTG